MLIMFLFLFCSFFWQLNPRLRIMCSLHRPTLPPPPLPPPDMHLHSPAHPGTENDAHAEHTEEEGPEMTVTDQVNKNFIYRKNRQKKTKTTPLVDRLRGVFIQGKVNILTWNVEFFKWIFKQWNSTAVPKILLLHELQRKERKTSIILQLFPLCLISC